MPTDRSASPLTAAQPARSLRRASPDSDCIEVEERPEETQVRFIRSTMEYIVLITFVFVSQWDS